MARPCLWPLAAMASSSAISIHPCALLLPASLANVTPFRCKYQRLNSRKLLLSLQNPAIVLLVRSNAVINICSLDEYSSQKRSAMARKEAAETPSVAEKRKNFRVKSDSNGRLDDCVVEMGGNVGDPLGKKTLGGDVVRWIARGMNAMATEIANAEKKRSFEVIQQKLVLGKSLVKQAKLHIEANSPPEGCEERCLKALNHYPTLFDHFQRELQSTLTALQKQGVVADWEQSESWKLFKTQTKTDDHRGVARIRTKEVKNELGLAAEKVAEIQDTINTFAEKFLELLHIERVAELSFTDTSLESTSNAVAVSTESRTGDNVLDTNDVDLGKSISFSNVRAISSSTGLGGLHLICFEAEAGKRLSPISFSPGDMVQIRLVDTISAGYFRGLQGTVYSIGENGLSMEVALAVRYGHPAVSKLFGNLLEIEKIPDLANTVTFERNCGAMEQLKIQGLKKRNPAAAVVATLFGEGPEISQLAVNCPKNLGSNDLDSAICSVDGFDESQQRAIHSALNKHKPVVVIQGPPGTGKTRVVVEVIVRAVSRGEKILATAPTNAAVDNLVERLALANIDIVRIGNPMRMAASILCNSLSVMVKSRLSKFEKEFVRKRRNVRRKLMHCGSNSETEVGLKQTLKQLSKSYKQKEQETIGEIIRSAQVVLSTNIGSGDPLLKNLPAFDLVVLDEAGQAIEPACWISMLKGKRTLLAGDNCQLSPVVISRQALGGGLGVSLMERASNLHGGILSTMLTVQYRMHDAIASWSSQEMYGGILQSDPSVSSHLLRDLPSVQASWITTLPLLLLDTRLPKGNLMAGCEECLDSSGTGSFYNEGEADIVIEHVKALLAAGVEGVSIVVQSPYLAQVELIQDRLLEVQQNGGVQVASIDSFQGREADAVIISMVRSNSFGLVGFLDDCRRMNVAITRARKHVTLVCDTSTVGCNIFLRRLLQHFRSYGEVCCAQLRSKYSESYASAPV